MSEALTANPSYAGLPRVSIDLQKSFMGWIAGSSPAMTKLEHDPEKCEAVFRKDHAQTIT
jgi:hypothetical protein